MKCFRLFAAKTTFLYQLYITMALAIMFIAAIASFTIAWLSGRQNNKMLIEQGLATANYLANRSQLALIYEDPSNAEEAITRTFASADAIAVELRHADGRLLTRKVQHHAVVPDLSKEEVPPANLNDGQPRLERETDNVWLIVAPILAGGQADAQEQWMPQKATVLGYVRVVKSKATLVRMLHEIYIANFTVSFLVAIVLLIIVRMLTAQMMRPLNRLAETMTQAESGKHGVRAMPSGPRDIMEMALIFNKMMDVLETRERELDLARDKAIEHAHERLAFAKNEQDRLERTVEERTRILKELLETRAQIVSNASHELRTPVNALRLLLDGANLRGKERRQDIQKIDAIVDHMSRLVENLLLLNVESDLSAQPGERKDFDLCSEIRATGNLLESIRHHAGVRFWVEVSAECDNVWVLGDLTALRRILINLLSNAFKFTNVGTVTMRAALQRDAAAQRVRCTITVLDTGIGLPENLHERIFEPFVTTRSHSGHTGTGLGLPISRQLAREMGGDLRLLRSVEHQGSEFECEMWFDLVAIPDEATPRTPVAQPPKPSQCLRVLLAEDDPTTSDAMAIIISYLNHDLDRVASIEDLESCLVGAQPPYDVALIDNRLPGGRGLDVIRKARMQGLVPTTKLVLLSAETGTVLEGARVLCDGVLTKPTSAASIQQLLGKAAPPTVQKQEMPIFDPAPLMMLRNNGASEAQIRKMWDMFVVSMGQALGSIRQLPPLSDEGAEAASIGDIVHRLGSSCATIGAVALEQALQELRDCVTKEAAEKQLKRIEKSLETTQAAFEEQVFKGSAR